jgi:hypothetical protein
MWVEMARNLTLTDGPPSTTTIKKEKKQKKTKY